MLQITDEELKKFTGSTNSLKTEDFADTLKVVFNRQIIPYLSQEQFIVSEASTSNIHILLIESVKRAVCCLAIAKDYMRIVLQLEKGAVKDKSVKESKAAKEDKEKSRDDYYKEGYESVEEMIALLESNVSTFTQWRNSSSFTILKDCFVNSAKIFDDYVDINASRRTFLKLKSHIRNSERLILYHLIDIDLVERLKANFQTDTLSPLERVVVEMIHPVIANHAIADALRKGSVIKDAYNTFTIFDNTSLSKPNNDKSEKEAEAYYLTAIEYGEKMQIFIGKNKIALGIVPVEPEEGYKFMNDPDAGFVLF